MIKRINTGALALIALVMLFNPNINLLDLLPDCIAYLLLIFIIKDASDTVPYLAECKGALGKLALVSGLKIPAFTVMYNNLSTGRDIIPMFTLIFVALEFILLYSAISNGYKALAYIGERTDASVTLKPFAINKKGGTMSPSALKVLTFIFFFVRGILNLLPELLLLTPEDVSLRRKLADSYPAVLIACIFAALIAGIIWLTYARKYLKSLRADNSLAIAVEGLKTKETPEKEKRAAKLKSLLDALTVLAVSSLFSFDLTFSNFEEMNILPHFIYGLILFYAIFNLVHSKKIRIMLATFTTAFTIASIASNRLLSRFLERYSYLYLLYTSDARRLYLPVKISGVVEAICIVGLLVLSAIAFAEFVKSNTGISKDDEAYGLITKKSHRALIIKGSLLFGMAALINILKCVNIFLKGMVKIEFSDINESGFATGAIPWMGTLIFAICVVFVIYSFYFISDVKNEVKFKYSEE